MHLYVGVWIDHAKAYIVKSNALAEMSIERFQSEVEPHHKGGHDNSEHQTLVNQRAHDQRRHNQMKAFSKELLPHLKEADELVIFGPGTAKHEFKNVLDTNKALAAKLKGLESADEMTEAELKEFMKHAFGLPKT